MPATERPEPRRVFLSYSHDSAAHAERVLALADRLRQDGLDAWIDQYDPEPAKGWARWMVDQIGRADRVLTICTETYRRRFEGQETRGGRGADWEGAILTEELYRRHHRFVIPVVLDREHVEHVPTVLRSLTYHVVDGESGYLGLYRLLTDQPATPAGPIGGVKAVEPQRRRSTFGLLSAAPTSPEPTASEALSEYRAWAVERYGHLNLIGLGAGDVRVSLEKIYVPLRTLERTGHGPGDLVDKRSREDALTGRADAVSLDRLFLRFGAAPRARHALIFGEPGSGKTTALRKLHQLALGEAGGTGGPEALGLAPGTLPVFLRLRRFTPDLLEHGLDAFVQAELRELSGGRLAGGTAAELWKRRRLLLLLDGLDEIADQDHRAKVLDRLVWHLAEPQLADVRAVVSCRYEGWSAALGDARLETFLRLDVRPFDDDQIARLVVLWFREVARRGYLDGAVAAERARVLCRVLTHPEQRRQEFLTLVATPLLLTLLCLVVMRGGEIPRRRVDFYEECLRILVREWRSRETRREPPISAERALRLLGELAWYLHSRHRRDDLTFPQALRVFHGRLRDRALASAVFRWLLEDAALLDRYTERHYGFAHLHLQEHLTARHLAEHDELLDRVCEERDDSWWHEVMQLLAGLPDGRGFAPLMRRLLATEVPLRRAGLLADCLHDAADPDLEPFYEVLRGDSEPERKAALLRLLRGRRETELVDLAATLAEAGPGAVGAMARQVLETARAPEEVDRADVFLLHDRVDERPAGRLAERLRQRTLRVDRPALRERWDDPSAVDRMLASPRVFVLLGAGTPEPEDVLDALALLDGEAAVVSLPGDPRPGVPEGLETLEHFDLPGFEAGIGALVEAVSPPVLAAGEPVSVEAGPSTQAPAAVVDEPFTEPLTGELFLPVPEGVFEMGGTVHPDEQPVHRVRLSSFWLARTPVTNQQYRQFLEAEALEEPRFWRDRRFSRPDQPVVGVSWHDAVTYCRWLSERSPVGRVFELPTEAQWEYAARGADGREYPWGNEPPDSERACFDLEPDRGQPAAVGSFLTGAGPFGHLDLVGNVWEWCRDHWEPNYGRWADEEPIDPIGTSNEDARPLRGGAWWRDAALLRSAGRHGFRPGYRGGVGFRVSCSASSTAP